MEKVALVTELDFDLGQELSGLLVKNGYIVYGGIGGFVLWKK